MAKNTDTEFDRAKVIAEMMESVRHIRSNIHPDVLQQAKDVIQNCGREQTEIKIDRQRNVKFVMDFLNSPAGQHLKNKIQS